MAFPGVRDFCPFSLGIHLRTNYYGILEVGGF